MKCIPKGTFDKIIGQKTSLIDPLESNIIRLCTGSIVGDNVAYHLGRILASECPNNAWLRLVWNSKTTFKINSECRHTFWLWNFNLIQAYWNIGATKWSLKKFHRHNAIKLLWFYVLVLMAWTQSNLLIHKKIKSSLLWQGRYHKLLGNNFWFVDYLRSMESNLSQVSPLDRDWSLLVAETVLNKLW